MKTRPVHPSSFNLHPFFDKFDLLADAPGAVAKMRELILELAVRGQLLSSAKSDSTDPADPSQPFPIPAHWQWATLGEAAQPCGQKKPDSRFTYVDVGAIDNVRGQITRNVQELEAAEAPSRARKLVLPGSVLYATVRPYLRNIAIVERQFTPSAIVSTAFAVLHPRPSLDVRFLFYWLRGRPFQDVVSEKMKGVAYPAISDSEFWRCPIPLPPLAEQRRIVAKVDELMGLCDRLEEQQKEREVRHAALARASLSRFADAPTPANLDFLFHSSYTIQPSDLRKSILTLAVQGKLVPQDPEDEPVDKCSKGKSGPSLTEDEAPFVIPCLWMWKRLGDIALIERGGSPRPIKDYITDDPNGFNWIKIGDTEMGGKYITSTRERIRKEGLSKTRRVYPGDFLLTNSMSFGRPYITKIEGCIHDGWLRIHPPDAVGPEFLFYLLSCPYVDEFFSRAAAGAVVQNLNADKVRELVIPIPPLAEQHRIVAKVDQLMALVDQLEARLDSSRTAAANLLDAVVAELTGAPGNSRPSSLISATAPRRRGRPRKS